jgi:hypothetical protein
MNELQLFQYYVLQGTCFRPYICITEYYINSGIAIQLKEIVEMTKT